MKILAVNIRNFGKLSSQSFSFHDGCNALLRENGWGKSTLAAFIRIMLYGFDGGSRRSESIRGQL